MMKNLRLKQKPKWFKTLNGVIRFSVKNKTNQHINDQENRKQLWQQHRLWWLMEGTLLEKEVLDLLVRKRLKWILS